MQWIAPSEKDTATNTLEKRLWEAADQLRANSGLTVGAVFDAGSRADLSSLRGSAVRQARATELEKAGVDSGAGGSSRIDEPAAYHAEGVVYLTPNARYDHLLNLPEGANVGKEDQRCDSAISKSTIRSSPACCRTLIRFSTARCSSNCSRRFPRFPRRLEYDAFGRIYEYFLGEFARTEGQKGGEFLHAEQHRPPDRRRCSSRITAACSIPPAVPAACSSRAPVSWHEHREESRRRNSPFTVRRQVGADGRALPHEPRGPRPRRRHPRSATPTTKTSTTAPAASISRSPIHRSMSTPWTRTGLKTPSGRSRRFPFGLPRTDNANYLWIQLFYSSLNDKGRAGFVMANSAGDARASEKEMRRQLIELSAVDVMVAIGTNFFYTVTLP